MRPPIAGWLLLVALGALVLGGCARKAPSTLPLAPGAEREAAVLWSRFVDSRRPEAVDADIRLGWDVLGSKGAMAATLQAQRPALLRFAANDPLGRALFLVVSDGKSFTMIDNRIGQVYQGTTDTKFWRKYVPETVAPEDLFAYLGGFAAAGIGRQARPSQDSEGAGFWYDWHDAHALRHHVLLDRQSGHMRRHLLFDHRDGLVLELDYQGYRSDPKSGLGWPERVQITGEAITGTLTIQVEQVYSYTPLAASQFRLTPPPHFTVEDVP